MTTTNINADNFFSGLYKKNEDVISRKIAGEMFLVPVKGKIADMQAIFTLNPVAEYIWQSLDEQKNLDDICSGIVDNFEVGKSRAKADLQELIAELIEVDLIKKQA